MSVQMLLNRNALSTQIEVKVIYNFKTFYELVWYTQTHFKMYSKYSTKASIINNELFFITKIIYYIHIGHFMYKQW